MDAAGRSNLARGHSATAATRNCSSGPVDAACGATTGQRNSGNAAASRSTCSYAAANAATCWEVKAVSANAQKFGLPDHGDDAMSAILAALCLHPSATTPPPVSVLLKTKTKVQFDRSVTDRSKPFFHVFHGFNRGQFRPCFLVPAVRSAEGRNQARSKRQLSSSGSFRLIASC